MYVHAYKHTNTCAHLHTLQCLGMTEVCHLSLKPYRKSHFPHHSCSLLFSSDKDMKVVELPKKKGKKP